MKTTRATCLAAIGLISSVAFAQNDPKGLDALSDDRLYSELSKRNLGGLLDYAFKKNNVPVPKQQAVRAGSALARLQDDPTIGLNDKRKLVAEYVKALPQLLPLMTDPGTLMQDGNILIEHGILTDQRLLEYFGPNATIMARLHPVTDAVQNILAKARDEATKAADKAANNWPGGRTAWETADQRATIAEYTRNIINYSSAISLDKASQERDKRLAEGLENLAPYNDESNENVADVKFYLAKLNMARLTPESLAEARKEFAFVVQKGDPKNVGQQFDARLLSVVTEINAKDAKAADAALTTLDGWVKQTKLESPEVLVALAAMKYRILVLKNETVAADKVLDTLQREQPALRGLILELMAANVPADAPVKDLNLLLLQSLRAKGEGETIKPDDTPFDKAVIERGLEASREIIKRGGKENEQVVQESLYVNGFFLQKLGDKENAAAAFLDYVDKYKLTDKERGEAAFNNAIALVGQLYREKIGDPAVTKLYDRVLEIAVAPPFERPEFYFERARRLQSTAKLDEAIALYDKIPEGSKQAGEARYFKMVAVHQKLQKVKEGDAARPALLTELQKLADQVNASVEQQIATATDEKVKLLLRTRLSQTRLLAADVALVDQKDPKRAIALLTDFEKTVKGLANEPNLISQVLLIRVKSYVQTNQVAEGVKEIQKLAVERPKEAMQIIFDLMDKLNEQVTSAEAAGQTEQVAQLERTRAELTPVLVKLIRESNNPELKKFDYQISVFDADQQRRAAELTQDEAKRTQLLKGAVQRFDVLDGKDQFANYLAALPEDKQKKARYDPQVKLGIARSNFALGDWDKARRPLAQLFADKVLGDGFIVKIGPDGTPEEVDNPTYWEATYKLIKSNVELKDNVEGMTRWVNDLYRTWGLGLGGQRWAEEFKKLRKDLDIPDAPPPAPAPTA